MNGVLISEQMANVLTDDPEILPQAVAHKYATHVDQDAESLVGHLQWNKGMF